MDIFKRFYGIFLVVISVLFMNAPLMAGDAFSPYGTSKKNLHDYPKISAVFDANYTDPKSLNILYAFVKNTMKPLKVYSLMCSGLMKEMMGRARLMKWWIH